jgi:protein-S-isoprenylcysteine O-methyltransferase Ste14
MGACRRQAIAPCHCLPACFLMPLQEANTQPVQSQCKQLILYFILHARLRSVQWPASVAKSSTLIHTLAWQWVFHPLFNGES